MNFDIFQWRSIKTRVTLLTLIIFMISIWMLTFYVSRILREDMQRVLSAQQFSMASIIAADVNDELNYRFSSLKAIADQISPTVLSNTAALQTLIEQQPILPLLFQGYEGSVVFVNRFGIESLTSTKRIPTADWFVAVDLPTAEAFSPINDMEQHVLIITIIMTFLTGGLIWFAITRMLQRQLSPMFLASKTLTTMSNSDQPPQLLPVTSQDEIGQLIGSFNCLLETLGRRDEALRESEERYSITLAAVYDGIWDWHVPSGDAFFSPIYYALLGYDDREFPACYASWRGIVHTEDIEWVERDLRESIETGKGFDIALRMRMKSGEWLWVSTRGKTAERDKDGKAVRMVGTLSDITKRKRAEQELQDKNTEMERFTYTVSHDLKSPLITIQTYAGMIVKDLEAGRHERAMADMKRIEDAASKMTDLLNDLLELSRVGRQMNLPSRIDMNRLVQDTLGQLAGPLKQNQIEVAVQPDLPAVFGDQKRIAEVVQNLIENAVKYRGDQKTLHIEIGTTFDGQETVFFVKDNGKGIDPTHHERIFGLFNKLDANSEGTGVGLALVKRIIEVHGGRVWVESEGVGMGSTFCFTLAKESLVVA